MRTEKPTSIALAVARFGSRLVRFGRGLALSTPAFRWSLALGGLAVLVLLGYLATPVPSGGVFLRAGQRFSSGEVTKIRRVLDAQRIDYRVDDQRRIEVPSDRLEDAQTALSRIDIGDKSIEELSHDSFEPRIWDDLWVREQRQVRGREEILAAMIANLDGIVSAYVTINRPKPKAGVGHRPGAGPELRPTAFVWLETEGSREIRHGTVQSIQNIIVGNEPDLKHDAVTVFDQKGRHYLVAGDPKYSTLSATRAREDDLSQRILELIEFVDGVRVTVQIVPAVPSPSPSPAISTLSLAPPLDPVPPPAPPALAVRTEPAGPLVGVNTPLELDPDPTPAPAPVSPTPAAGIPASTPHPGPAATPMVAASTLPDPSASKETARVWVRVPRSYYFNKAGLDRDSSPDRFKGIVERTETLIREAVAHVVPPELGSGSEPADLKIDTIPDDVPQRQPLRSQVVPDSRRPLSWWLSAGLAVGGLVFVLSALGVRKLAGRRQLERPRRLDTTRPGRYRTDAAGESGPGPAERVRELIRRNPEAAASVLHRWIGQGEGE